MTNGESWDIGSRDRTGIARTGERSTAAISALRLNRVFLVGDHHRGSWGSEQTLRQCVTHEVKPSGTPLISSSAQTLNSIYWLDPALLGLWCRLAAGAPIQPLAWEPPYAEGVVLKSKKKESKNLKFPLLAKDSPPSCRFG